MIVILDIGIGNTGSILNMLKKVNAKAVISSTYEDLEKADKIILPGVGSFDNAMHRLHQCDVMPILNDKVLNRKTPILGICLGMQLLSKKSEEGILPGLGWIDAETIRFNFSTSSNNLKIPHMGWNTVNVVKESRLFDGTSVDLEKRFYFVHSYHMKCNNQNEILAKTFYGYDFVSAVIKDNIVGVQFHPEKSHKFGLELLNNFAERF